MPTFQVALIHTMPFPNNLSALLFQMQNRLGMYINPPILPSLMNFISGYTMATRCHHIDEPGTLRPFHDFVAQQLGYAESTAGFANMILAYVYGFSPANIDWPNFLSQPISAQQHAQAVELFYRLLKAHQPAH